MYKIRQASLVHFIILIGLLVVCYYLFLTNDNIKRKYLGKYELATTRLRKHKQYNIWLIFTKVSNTSTLKYKFRSLLENLLNITSVPLFFNIIVDAYSKEIAEAEISDLVLNTNQLVPYKFYDVDLCAEKVQDIVSVMTPHFSSKPGTYYSGALFYISLGLHRIAPANQNEAILLDCDLYFKDDVALLFEEFDKFKSTALIGLAPELSPVYKHILHTYKKQHKTSFGEYYRNSPIEGQEVHPRGFQGYNSGVVLANLKKLRESEEFKKVISNETVQYMVEKYKFRGHLGDQDFYTLMGFEFPDLIQTISCGYNRQLCTWWKDHGYKDIFDLYFKCEEKIVVLHGNCNTNIPK